MKRVLFGAALAMAAAPALGEEFRVGGGLTSLGPVVEGVRPLSERFALRGQLIGGLSVTVNSTFGLGGSDYDIDGSAHLGGVMVLGDYHPLASGWRISGGLFVSNSDLEADFVGPVTFSGEIRPEPQLAAVLTTGYTHALNDTWMLSADIGAIFSQLRVRTANTSPDVLREVELINDDLDDLPVLPFASVTFSYIW